MFLERNAHQGSMAKSGEPSFVFVVLGGSKNLGIVVVAFLQQMKTLPIKRVLMRSNKRRSLDSLQVVESMSCYAI